MEAPTSPPSAKKRRMNQRTGPPRIKSTSDRSSTSSDILVAAGPPSTGVQTHKATKVSTMDARSGRRYARVDNGMLKVSGLDPALLRAWSQHNVLNQFISDEHDAHHTPPEGGTEEDDGDDQHPSVSNEIEADDNDGPNERGTYSKAYTLKHPETKWTHRGQGRYLPTTAIKQEVIDLPLRSTRHSGTNASTPKRTSSALETVEWLPKPLRSRSSAVKIPTPRKRHSDLSQHFENAQTSYTLRHRHSEPDNPSAIELRSARLARRAKVIPSTEYRTQQSTDDSDEDEDMEESKQTFRYEYVQAHPQEAFYHTGNGWWKRGTRPAGSTSGPKRRDFSRSMVKGQSEVSDGPDPNRTYHATELEALHGHAFHHCGNGYYKLGPAPARRQSNVAPEGSEDEDEDDGFTRTVSKEWVVEYQKRHPEVDFVHRGNGRYLRKDAAAKGDAGRSYMRQMLTFDKEYVQAHPNETFYHAGYGRYRRGCRPTGPQQGIHPTVPRRDSVDSAQNARDEDEEEDEDEAEDEEDDGEGSQEEQDDEEDHGEPEGLVNKDYTLRHPSQEFHHRGQGRWARGPRPTTTRKRSVSTAEVADDALVSRSHVEAHLDELWHHRGQGRWARGPPPPGSSAKTAVRGAGSEAIIARREAEKKLRKASSTPSVTTSYQVSVPDALALVRKDDGPERWPDIKWHYRGGGKWSQTHKSQLARMGQATDAVNNVANNRAIKMKRKPKARNGPEAQLEREAAATEKVGQSDSHAYENEELRDGLDAAAVIPKMSRKRSYLVSQDDTKRSSKTSTPKPQMLAPEDDILADEDFPQLYGDGWLEPGPGESDDEAAQLMRQLYRPLNSAESFVKSLTKHDPAARSTDNLYAIAEHAQAALKALQDEYLQLEKITAPHARIPRKPAKGGRVPVDPEVLEDRKEADLYDYNFDPRRVGFQDPEAQRIVRDAEGRELRNRRVRSGGGFDTENVAATFLGDEDKYANVRSRTVKPVDASDGVIAPARKRRNLGTNTARASETPEPMATQQQQQQQQPPQVLPNGFVVPSTGRWAGHVPKRIRELRGDSVGSVKSNGGVNGEDVTTKESTPVGGARKGRPPGSKNHHKRKDAGIPKGPKKPKVVDSIEASPESTQVKATQTEDGVVDAAAGAPLQADGADGIEHGPEHKHNHNDKQDIVIADDHTA